MILRKRVTEQPDLSNTNRFRFAIGFPSYLLDAEGELWSRNSSEDGRWIILNGSRGSKRRYRLFHLWNEKKCHHRYLHELLLEAFIGPRPEGMCGRHKDDNVENNHIDNLLWGTLQDNYLDCLRNGNFSICKLNESAVKDIRRLHATGLYTLVELSERYGVNPETIGHVVKRLTWKHV